jgi:hypothetical protein
MTSVVIPAKMADVEEAEVVVAHRERATLRVGDVFLKIDADHDVTEGRGALGPPERSLVHRRWQHTGPGPSPLDPRAGEDRDPRWRGPRVPSAARNTAVRQRAELLRRFAT